MLLLCFLVVYFVMGIATGDFANFPLMIGMFLAMAISLVIKKPGGDTLTFSQKVDLFCQGGGDQTLILMIIIYMLAGAFYGVAGAMGATTNNTMSIIACGPIARELSEKYKIPPARVASILDLFTSAPQSITPYAGQLLAIGGLAAISPITVAPFVFYSWLMFIFGIIFILIGFPKMVYKPREEKAADAE